MQQRKHTVEQIIVKLREIEHLCQSGRTLEEAQRCVGISEHTYCRWRERFGWMTSDEYVRMRQLEEENHRLKELVQMWNITFGNEMDMDRRKVAEG